MSESAARILQFLQQLATLDAVFAQTWHKCGTSLDEAMSNKVELNLEALMTLLEKGRHRMDIGKAVIEELGFSLGRLWNGLEDSAAHVSLNCGAFPDPAKMPGVNDVLIELPYEGSASQRLLRIGELRRIVRVVVQNWDPDWLRVSSFKMDEITYPDHPYKGQRAGWMTYVSHRYPPLPQLPEDCIVERVSNLGSLIIINSITHVTASNPAHVTAVRQLSEVLDTAGLLAPVPPASVG